MEWLLSFCCLCAVADYSVGTDGHAGILAQMTVCEGACLGPVRLWKKACDRPWRDEHAGISRAGKGHEKLSAPLRGGRAVCEAVLENEEGRVEELLSSETFAGSFLMVGEVHTCYDQMGLRDFLMISAERDDRCGV